MKKLVRLIGMTLIVCIYIFTNDIYSQCPYSIDQEQGYSNIGVYGTDQWQSFKSGGSQKVGSLDLYSNAAYEFNGNIVLKLYPGTGTGGTFIYTETYYFDTIPSGWILLEIDWDSAPILTNGSTYTLRVETSNNLYLRANNGNLYSDGYYSSNEFGANSGWDLMFRSTWGDPVTAEYNLIGDDKYCEVGNGAQMSMSDTKSGVNYKLYRDGSHVQTKAGTGGSVSFSNQYNEGNYTVIAENPSTTCTYDMLGSIDLVEIPIPIVDAGLDYMICGYEHTMQGISADNYSSLAWTTSGTGIFDNNSTLSPIYTASDADLLGGTVILTLTVQPNIPCANPVSDEMELKIFERADAGPDEIICKGEDFLLNGNFYGDVPIHDTSCVANCDMPQHCVSSSINFWYLNYSDILFDGTSIIPTTANPVSLLSLIDSVYFHTKIDSAFQLKIYIANFYNLAANLSVFFDWNRDGDFDDVHETVGYSSFSKTGDTYTSNITVPPGAVMGDTKMRVITSLDNTIYPCGVYYIGQTADVKINVSAKTPDYDIWYDWAGPNGFISTEQRPVLPNVSIYESGVYNLEMTNEFGCVTNDDIELTILPNDTLTPDTEICYGETVTLEVTGPAALMQTYSFEWSNTSTNTSITVSPSITTTYYVTVTGTVCTTVDSVIVTVHQLPIVDLGSNTSLCRYTVIEIDSSYVSYDWNSGYTDTYSFELDVTDSYTVVVIDTNGCTGTSNTVLLTVLETPAGFTGLDADYLTNASPVTLTGSPTGGIFSGNGISGDVFSPVNAGIGIHEITYTYVDANPCSNTETQSVMVYANDMSLNTLVSPITGFLTAYETVTVIVENRGLNAIDNILVSFHSTSPGAPAQTIDISEIVSETIDPGNTLTYTFSQTVDMSTEEEYFCTASVTTPSDDIESNDSLDVTITNYIGATCQNPFEYTFTANSIPTINHSISSTNWYEFTLDSAYINFSLAFTPDIVWSNMDVDIWQTCNMSNEVIPTTSSFLPASITLNFDTIWAGTYIVRVIGDGDYSLDVTGYNGIYGCTNPNSPTYNPVADFDDGSCENMSYSCGTNPIFPFNSIPAQISSDITWNTDSIIIDCDVDILDGVTVTVAPGTVVLFNNAYTINVKGTFIASGNMLDSIFFKGIDNSSGAHFVFDNGPYPGASGAMSNNDTSRFEYCYFYDNHCSKDMIRANNFSKLMIHNSRFGHNWQTTIIIDFCGIILCENSSDIIISQNFFDNNQQTLFTPTYGGIIVCDNSNPTISYNTISANITTCLTGGMIVCANSSNPDINRNIVTVNLIAGESNGAICCASNSNPNVSLNMIIENNIFSNVSGAGIVSTGASGTFFNNVVSHNISLTHGGFVCSNSTAEIVDNIIQFNLGSDKGGGIAVINNSNVRVSNCMIHGNRSIFSPYTFSGLGGGFYVSASQVDIYNCVITFNDGMHGGAIAATDLAQVNSINNTISNNFSYQGGAMMTKSADANFTNTIIYGNNSQNGEQVYNMYDIANVPEINFVHCNIEDGQNGILNELGASYTGIYTNSFDEAPYFVDTLGFNFELQFQSACINGGTIDTTGLGIPSTDIVGLSRILNDTIDIGAYEATQIGTCGNITENTVWDADTICVACDILVQDSATLTINPGTVVEFLGSYKLNIQGNLLAVGTPSDSIIFTIADTTGFHDFGIVDGGWKGIQFDNGPLGAFGSMDDNDSSLISYSRIMYGKAVENYQNGFSYLTDELLTLSDPNDFNSSLETMDVSTLLGIDTVFDKGGAIYVNNLSKLRISNSDLIYNKAYIGGSFYCENNASPLIVNSKICNNEAKTFGGGVFIAGSNPKIVNSLICNNSALEQSGGGISCYFSMPEFTNLTVSNNTDFYMNHGLLFVSSVPIIKNSVLWGNANVNDNTLVIQSDTLLNVNYSNVQGLPVVLGNVSSLPNFVSPTIGCGSGYDALSENWSINPASPCVNAGMSDTSGLSIPLVDLANQTRILNDTIDIGAYEVERILGCTNPAGLNYNPLANVDDGSCEYTGEICLQAINYGVPNDPAISGLIAQSLDKWAYFTINADYKYVIISMCGSNFDTQLELWEDCDSLNFIAYNDNSCGTQSEITFNNLDAGTYYVRMYGSGIGNGSFELEITGTEVLNTTLSATHVSCYGYSDGEVDMTISGGAPPYTIEWSNGMTMEDLTGIVAGVYGVTVTDTESTSFINTMTVTEPDAPIRDYVIKHVVCHGDATGEIDLTIDGANSPFTYEWTGGETSEDLINLIAGSYDITITGNDGCIVNDAMVVNQTDLITPTFVIDHVSCYGESDGAVDQSVTGGILPFSFEWTFSFDTTFAETTEDLSVLAYGTYSLTITDDSACQVSDIAVIYEPDLLELSIAETSVSIAGASDGIADLSVTGGMIPYTYEWSNVATTEDLTAIPEGNYSVTVTDDHACTETVSVYVPEPSANITQTIPLPVDWSIFSTYIISSQPDIADVLANIVANVIIAKNGDGQVYYPAYGTNLIGDLTIGDGYQIKMLNADVLDIYGTSVIPENTHLSIDQGWSILGYLRHPTGPIVDMLSDITSEIVIVKNGGGGIYWPGYYVDMIGNMIPGEGYKIKMSSAATLTYPSNNYSSAKFTGIIPVPVFYSEIKTSDNNLSLCIPDDTWNIKPEPGDEIAVFSEYGDLCGSCVYAGGNVAITIWGNDEYSEVIDGLLFGEEFLVRLWHKSNNSEEILEIENWIEGDEYYSSNKIAVVKTINQSSFINNQSSVLLYQNIPNPFSGETEISFYLPEETYVEICVFNVFGELVENLVSRRYGKGIQSVRFNSKDYASGNYYYKIITPGYVGTKSMNIMKY